MILPNLTHFGHDGSCYFNNLSDPTRSIVVIWVNFFQAELMVEICSKSLVEAFGKVLLLRFS